MDRFCRKCGKKLKPKNPDIDVATVSVSPGAAYPYSDVAYSSSDVGAYVLPEEPVYALVVK